MRSIESFPERLKAYRKSMGWTQEELAKKWDYSLEAISAWERGKRKPGGQQIPRIAHLMKMEPEELVKCIETSYGRTNTQSSHETHSDEMQQEWIKAYETWGEIQHIFLNRSDISLSHDFSYPRMFEDAYEILAVGISLNAIAMNYSRDKIIKLITEKKGMLTLCFLDPKGECCTEREREENLSPGQLADLTHLNISNMEITKKHIDKIDTKSATQLQIKTYNMPPRYNIYVVDDTLMTVQSYAYGRGEDTPTFVLKRRSDNGLFEFYTSVARHILEQANPVIG